MRSPTLPSLIWIPAGLRTGADLRVPLGGFFAKHGVVRHYLQAFRAA